MQRVKKVDTSNAKFKVLDLFSGIGGFSLGLERTGHYETVAFCEIDPFCQAVLRKHWPAVPIFDDVRTVNFREIEADVITGGFPCQDISNAGLAQGIEGSRSGLWSEIKRAICEIQPRYAIVENVSALTKRGLYRVLGDLAEIGYSAQWHCIPASALGAVHPRDRIWIIAYPSKVGWLVATQICAEIARNLCSARPSKESLSVLDCWRELPPSDTVPDVRKNDGLSAAVDRLGSLGNAIYPEIATLIGKALIAVEQDLQ